MPISQPPVDPYYYEILNVPTNAEYLVIKKAYKKLAIKYHPDKNKAPDAEEKFKLISEAYQVLGSQELRNKYDKYGRNDVRPADGFVDPCVQFQNMYGGDKFINIFGELNIGHFFAQETLEKTEDKHHAMLEATERIQKERVDTLASILKGRLSSYTSERLGQYGATEQPSTTSFEKDIRQEASDLRNASYGNSFLFVIGRLYANKAKEYIGIKRSGGLPGVYYSMKEKKYITKELWKTVKTNMDAQTVEKHALQAEADQDSDLLKDLEDLCMLRCYQSLWQMVKFEVEATLRKVCETVLQDKTVGSSERLLRAEGLLILGKIYESASNITEPENEIVQLL